MNRKLNKKDDTIQIRASSRQKKLLKYVASLNKMSLSTFVLEKACQIAEHDLVEHHNFALSPKQWVSFCSVLDQPARSLPQLKTLLLEKGLLDKPTPPVLCL